MITLFGDADASRSTVEGLSDHGPEVGAGRSGDSWPGRPARCI
jgi:hypothetical protein